jgi:hypothetical protein
MKSVPASVRRPMSLAHLQIEGSTMRKSKNSVLLSPFVALTILLRSLVLSAAFIAVGLVLPNFIFAQTDKSVNKYGIPNLKPNEVWVSSIPLNLKVYVAEQEANIVSDKYFVGRTPLVINLKTSRCFVACVAEDIADSFAELERGYIFSVQKLMDVTAKSAIGKMFVDATGKGKFEAILIYEIDYSKAQTLIALFQPRGISFDKLVSLYPAGNNFSFDEATLRQTIAQYNISQSEVDEAIKLLHRGGKIAIETKEGIAVIEMFGINRWKPIVFK